MRPNCYRISIVSRTVLLVLLALSTLWAADNPWAKVQDLKHGAELRIYRNGVREPLVAKFDEANDERILIVSKNSQMAVAKEDIDRLEARPSSKAPARKSVTETTSKTTEPDYTPHPPGGVPVPSTSYGSTVTWGDGSKAPFQLVYTRPAESPRK